MEELDSKILGIGNDILMLLEKLKALNQSLASTLAHEELDYNMQASLEGCADEMKNASEKLLVAIALTSKKPEVRQKFPELMSEIRNNYNFLLQYLKKAIQLLNSEVIIIIENEIKAMQRALSETQGLEALERETESALQSNNDAHKAVSKLIRFTIKDERAEKRLARRIEALEKHAKSAVEKIESTIKKCSLRNQQIKGDAPAGVAYAGKELSNSAVTEVGEICKAINNLEKETTQIYYLIMGFEQKYELLLIKLRKAIEKFRNLGYLEEAA